MDKRPRRAAGDGALYQDARGLWRGAVYLPTGRRAYVSATTETKARQKLRALQAQVAAGQLPTGRAPTVKEWVTYWLDNIAATSCRPSTLTNYRSKVDTLIVPHLGVVPITKLTPSKVEAWYATLLTSQSPQSILHAHRILSRALKIAHQRGLVHRNVLTLTTPPRVERPEIEPYTLDEVRRLLRAAEKAPMAGRWELALLCGPRQGEALGLSWAQLDLDEGLMTVSQALQRQKTRGLVLVPPKSRAGKRVVPLPPQVVAGLRRRKRQQARERLAAGTAWKGNPHDLVFTSPFGTGLSARTDWEAWRRLCAAAGVPVKRVHDARHTAITLLLAAGVDVRTAMEIAGHSSIAQTIDYSHVVEQRVREAAGKVADMLDASAATSAAKTPQKRASGRKNAT